MPIGALSGDLDGPLNYRAHPELVDHIDRKHSDPRLRHTLPLQIVNVPSADLHAVSHVNRRRSLAELHHTVRSVTTDSGKGIPCILPVHVLSSLFQSPWASIQMTPMLPLCLFETAAMLPGGDTVVAAQDNGETPLLQGFRNGEVHPPVHLDTCS